MYTLHYLTQRYILLHFSLGIFSNVYIVLFAINLSERGALVINAEYYDLVNCSTNHKISHCFCRFRSCSSSMTSSVLARVCPGMTSLTAGMTSSLALVRVGRKGMVGVLISGSRSCDLHESIERLVLSSG